MWLHSLKVAQLLRSAACLHTNQSRSYLNHLVLLLLLIQKQYRSVVTVVAGLCYFSTPNKVNQTGRAGLIAFRLFKVN